MASISVGVVGLGVMGQNHVRVLSQLPGVDLVAITDIDKQRESLISEKYGIERADDVADIMTKAEALVVAVPTSNHFEVLLESIGRTRAIMIEKPMTHSAETSRMVAQLAETKQTCIQVGYIERFNPVIEALVSIIEKNGPPLALDFVRTSRVSARITDVDVITDLMVHDIDLSRLLAGNVFRVQSSGIVREEKIELAFATLMHDSGVISRIHASRLTERKQRRITATFNDFFVECDLIDKTLEIFRQSRIESQTVGIYSMSRTVESVELQSIEPLVSELRYFVESIRMSRKPIPNQDDDISALLICESVREQIQASHNEISGVTR